MNLISTRENKTQSFLHQTYYLDKNLNNSSDEITSDINFESDENQTTEKKLKILLVEDDKILQHCHTSFLSSCNYTVEIAGTGTEAIAMFKKTIFDIVVLDIGLPDENIDGYDVCKMMKLLNRNIPVMFLSANDKEINKFEQSNGDYYMSKPPCFESMQRKINELIMLAKEQI